MKIRTHSRRILGAPVEWLLKSGSLGVFRISTQQKEWSKNQPQLAPSKDQKAIS
jgi:hypothetical protein